ncbi:MAG: EamA family transporter, partial [Cyclobacteriaceae bacterium]|nr:EamA family transporter [Cyclobacteriaceae bacterium]
TLLLLRMIFALPFYLFISIRETKKKNQYQLSRKDILFVFGLGFIGYYIASYFDFYGLQFISASLERLVLFIYPTLVIIISSLALKKKATKIQIYAILITYLGIFVAFADDLSFESERLWLGVISIIVSAFTYAFYLVGSGTLIPKLGSVRFTAYAMTASCLMVILHYSATNTYEVLNQPWEVYALGFAMAMASTVIPSFLISEAIKRLGASNFAIYGSLGPISTIILAIIFLGERIDFYQIIGTVIVIIGVSIINLKKA